MNSKIGTVRCLPAAVTFKLVVSAGRGIRRSSSQICLASRCCRKGWAKSSLSSLKFKPTAKRSGWCLRPLRSITSLFLDRRYGLYLCASLGEGKKVGGGQLAIWVEVPAVCVCLTWAKLWHIILPVFSAVIYHRPSLLFSVSDWGEELIVINRSTWLGQNQQVSSLTSETNTFYRFSHFKIPNLETWVSRLF